jgi:hypothetical protein
MKYSTKGYLDTSPDKNRSSNTIKGGDITMKGVSFSVQGTDNNGFTQLMHPGNDYKFPGADYVVERPSPISSLPFTCKHFTKT